MKTIRELRQDRFWTQSELAAKVGVTVYTISNWEREATRPRPPQVRALAEAFGIEPRAIKLAEKTKPRPAAK